MFGGKMLGNQKTIETPTLKIWGETLIFGKTILYIPNLSSIEAGEIRRSFLLYMAIFTVPLFYIVSMIADTLVVSAIVSIISSYFIVEIFFPRRYGLRLGSNSGEVNYLVSPDVQFIEEIAGVLYNVLNGVAHESYYVVNFDQRKITEIGEVTLTNSVGVFGDNIGKATVNKFVNKDDDDEELPL